MLGLGCSCLNVWAFVWCFVFCFVGLCASLISHGFSYGVFLELKSSNGQGCLLLQDG